MIKKVILIITCFSCWILAAFAQNPGFHYQASLKGISGDAIANQKLDVRITILGDGGLTYTESQTTSTNDFGIFSLEVGSQNTEAFKKLPWGQGPMSMQVEINDGDGFETFGSSNLMSVPYALFAENAGNSISDVVINELGELTLHLTNGRSRS